MKENFKKVNLTKDFGKAVVIFVFLAIVLGKESQISAQDFSNPVITTDCCPDLKKIVDSVIKHAPFVFEGRMIKKTSGKRNMYYLFEIEKVYRGKKQLQAGTVEIIEKWSIFAEEDKIDVVDSVYGNPWCIVFAKETDIPGAFDANNSIKLELFYTGKNTFSTSSLFREITPKRCCNGKVVTDPAYYSSKCLSLNFKTQKEVRDFLRTYKLCPKDISKKADILKTQTYKEIEKANNLK